MAPLPVGTLTFLLTDLEGSTQAWEAGQETMREAMGQHDALVYGAVQDRSGEMVETGREGDSILAVFKRATDAAACALEIQRRFRSASWPGKLRMRVRIAIHSGEAELRGGHYFGRPLNRCARVLALCNGGQTVITRATRELLADDAPSGIALTDLGVHQLKDLQRTEHLFQLSDTSWPEHFPPPRARRGHRTTQRAYLTSFVGRKRELTELRRLVARSRLLTITGTGGSGKTRLAMQLALEVGENMPGGAWLVDLAPVSDEGLVARAVATALDVEEQPGRKLSETLADRCGERAMLLTLDNCEHVVNSSAELAESLLAACPDLRLVATSREPLNLDGEVTWRVPALMVPDAVRLFVDRARSRNPSFRSTPTHKQAITDICRHLDGIPLAIELAAARTAVMTPEEISRRLGSGFAVLAEGSRMAARRQQTLEATIDWSYDLLTEPERTLLRCLGVFAGAFSIDAVESVCSSAELPPESLLGLLGQLVTKSLVQQIEDRYRCLDTIRAYARARLEKAGELAALNDRHAASYLTLAESRRPGQLADWLNQLAADHDNLRAALGWCIPTDPETGARLAIALYDFWLLRGFALEAYQFLEQVSARLPEASPRRARILLMAAVFAYTSGDLDAAIARSEAGLQIGLAAGNSEDVVRGLMLRGVVALARGQIEASDKALQEALELARGTDSRRQHAEVLYHMGVLASQRRNIAAARSLLTESLELRRRLGIADESATTLTLLAAVILGSDPAAARTAVMEALTICLSLRDRRAAWSLDVAACLAALDGDAGRALRLEGAAAAMFEATAQRPPPAWRQFTTQVMEVPRRKLGEERAKTELEAGRRLGFEGAVEYALEPGP